MSGSRHKQLNRYDKYGIYELVDERPKKKRKKKKFTPDRAMRMLITFLIVLVVSYVVSFIVKYTMKSKAISLYENEDYPGAIDLFNESLKPGLPLLESFDNDVRFYLGDCYVKLGDYSNACQEYNKIKLWSKERNKTADYYGSVAYGLLLYEQDEYRQALPILLKAYEDGYSDLVLYVGSCYGQIGDLSNMQMYYDIFLQNHEMNSFMYSQYASIELDNDNMEKALEYIEKGKQLEDQSNIRELLYDEIVYYEKLNDYNTAYEKAKEFVEMYPDDTDGKNEYDILYTRQDGADK